MEFERGRCHTRSLLITQRNRAYHHLFFQIWAMTWWFCSMFLGDGKCLYYDLQEKLKDRVEDPHLLSQILVKALGKLLAIEEAKWAEEYGESCWSFCAFCKFGGSRCFCGYWQDDCVVLKQFSSLKPRTAFRQKIYWVRYEPEYSAFAYWLESLDAHTYCVSHYVVPCTWPTVYALYIILVRTM